MITVCCQDVGKYTLSYNIGGQFGNIRVKITSMYTGKTLEILWVRLQTTTIKQILQYSKSHEFFGFPVHTEVMVTLYCSL